MIKENNQNKLNMTLSSDKMSLKVDLAMIDN